MKNSILSILLASICAVTMSAQNMQTITVNFASGSAKLTPEAQKKISDNIGADTTAWEKILVKAYTDAVGKWSSNLRLSRRRAQSVYKYLCSKGVNGKIITQNGYGEAHPIENNRTAAGRAANRRVVMDITFFPKPVEEPVVKQEPVQLAPPVVLVSNKRFELYSKLSSLLPEQSFVINREKGGSFKTRDSILVSFPAGAFGANTTDCDSIRIVVRELNSNSAAVLGNLQTLHSQNRYINPLGMFEVTAFCGNQPIEMLPGFQYTAFVPSRTELSEVLGSYQGSRSAETGHVTWTDIDSAATELNDVKGKDLALCANKFGPEPCTKFFYRMFHGKSCKEQHKGLSRKELKASIEKKKAKVAKLNKKFLGVDLAGLAPLADEFQYVVISPKQLGYANAGTFLDDQSNRLMEVAVALKYENFTDVQMVLEGTKAIINGTPGDDGTWRFKAPKGQRVKLVALKVNEQNGQIGYSITPMTIEAARVEINTEPVSTMESLEAVLKTLD